MEIQDKQYLISVIAIFYNSAKFCKKCIESLLGQKDVSLEVIAVDDCSTDETRAILTELAFKDNRIRLVFHEKNQGISGARNSGMANVKGDCFFFIDGDDWLATPYSLSKLLAYWDPNVDWVAGSYEWYDENDCKVRDNVLSAVHLTGKSEIQLKFDCVDWVYIHNRLFNRKYTRIRFIPGIIHEDRFWNLELYSEVNEIVQISDVTYNYFTRSDSFSSTSRFGEKFIKDGMLLLRKMAEMDNEWQDHAKWLSASFLKSMYIGNCSRRTRIEFLSLVRSNHLLLPFRSSKGSARYYRLVLGMTQMHIPDFLVKIMSICYVKLKRLQRKSV